MNGKIRADERGISPVLGAALTLGVIITISSVVLAVWVPSEVNRREYDHLQGVEESFRELKATIEEMWVGENRSVDLKMGPDTLPLVPNPKRGGTLSVTPAEVVIRSESGKIFRKPTEDVIYPLRFEILPGELEAYDWYIVARTGENKERIKSAFFYVNRDASGLYDYHYQGSQGLEATFPDEHGGMDNKLHEGWNYINIKVVSGPSGAWVEVYATIVPACTPPQDVTLENKPDLGSIRYDWEDQSWVYESGMIIWVQDNMSLMKSPPGAVTVVQVDNGNFEVHFNIIRIQRFEDSVSSRGTSTISVSILQEYEKKPEENRENVTIRINSRYRSAWGEYLADRMDELKNIDISAEIREEENFLTLTIIGGGKNIRFFQRVTNIEVKLG